MTLTNRLLLFHLGSLIILLTGFSTAIYFVAQDHLYRQAELRLTAAMNTLGAAIEIGKESVEWEPQERPIHLAPGSNPIVWCVTDATNKIITISENAGPKDEIEELMGRLQSPSQHLNTLNWREQTWQVGRRWYYPDVEHASKYYKTEQQNNHYSALSVTVAVSLAPTQQMLRQLMATLVAIAFSILGIALLAGRFVCRTAIGPVLKMAEDVRQINPADSTQRLTPPNGGDELTNLGVAFNDLLERLHESSERHRRFAGDASHQLRTPLAAILGQIEIALRRERSPQEYRETLATVQSKSKQLHRIVEALLCLTRTGSDAGLPRSEPIDLNTWLTEYLQQWESHARYSDMHILYEGGIDTIETQPVLLNEVLNVLIDNACRYSSPSSPIVVTHTCTEARVQIGVRDHGHGVAFEDQRQLFQPFFRTTESLKANRQGVGLGLSIAHRLVQTLGGELTVTSEPGLGSTFTISLPRPRPNVPSADREPVPINRV